MEVFGHIRYPDVLSLGKELPAFIKLEAEWTPDLVWTFGKRTKYLSSSGNRTMCRPARNLFIIPTMLNPTLFFKWHCSPNRTWIASVLMFLHHTQLDMPEWTLWLVAETLTNVTQTNIHAFSGTGTRDSSNPTASDLRWDRTATGILTPDISFRKISSVII